MEDKISRFHEKEDTILYASCFDANAGLFEQLLGPEDAVLSDALNHASIIDGIRLCKAKKYRYLHKDMSGKDQMFSIMPLSYMVFLIALYISIYIYFYIRNRFGRKTERFRELSNSTDSNRWSFFNGRQRSSSATNMRLGR